MSHLNPDALEAAQEMRLPAWALELVRRLRTEANYGIKRTAELQETIDKLEAQIAATAESDTGPEDSTAWLWREMGGEELPPLGLGADATVDYTPASGINITVEAHGNGIDVTSSLHLMVIPIGRTQFRIQPVSAKIKD